MGLKQRLRNARQAEIRNEQKKELQIQKAIFQLSLDGDADETTWEHAAEWQAEFAEPLPNVVEYLRAFGLMGAVGYDAMGLDKTTCPGYGC